MRTILFLLEKEFRQVFRNRVMLPVIFVMPVFQLLILSNAATFDIKNVRFHLIDHDQTATSRSLAEHFNATGYFVLVDHSFETNAGEEDLRLGRASLVVEIPERFERDLLTAAAKVQLTINAEDGSAAGIIQSYASVIINQFARDIAASSAPSPGIEIISRNWFNPELNYKWYMIPGILVALVSMVGLFLSSMNIVREKEIGTMEQLNVTPIQRYQFIIGKLFPFWIMGIGALTLGLIVARFAFSLPMEGSLALVYAVAAVYLVLFLSIGLLISTVSGTQQQAMLVAYFFMVVFMLLGGLFTPLESMPEWAQRTTWVNPVSLFIRIMRAILLKGAGLHDIAGLFAYLAVLAVVMMTIAIWRYRKTSD